MSIDTSNIITTRNIGSPNGNAVTPSSTVDLMMTNGDYDTCAIQVSGTYTGILTVQVTVDGTNWISLGGTTALINVSSALTAATIASGTQGIFQLDVSAFTGVRVTALAAITGAATVTLMVNEGSGIVGIDTPVVLAAGTAAIGTISTPTGSNIAVTSTASTNASVQKATAGTIFELTASNPTATAAFVKLYNKATAPTVGTDIPVLTIPLPAGSVQQFPFGQIGKRFATGIGMAITAGALATDTAVSVAGVQVHGTYI